MKEEWNECNGIGTIITLPFNDSDVSEYDEYDERGKRKKWMDTET